MRLSGAMDPDQGVPVSPLVQEREDELKRRSPVALGNYPAVRCQDRSECRREAPAEGARVAVWGIEEHEIVLGARGACPLEEVQGPRAAHVGVEIKRSEIPANRSNRGRR